MSLRRGGDSMSGPPSARGSVAAAAAPRMPPSVAPELEHDFGATEDWTSPAVRRARLQYHFKAGFLLFFILCDVFMSTIADFYDNPNYKKWYPLVLLGAQFLVIVLTTLLLFMMLFATYLFEVGLINVLLKEFRAVLLAIPAYLVVYVAYAAVKLDLILRQELSRLEVWEKGSFVTMSVIQKLASPLYYLLFVRAVVKLGQSRWYLRAPWVQSYQANV